MNKRMAKRREIKRFMKEGVRLQYNNNIFSVKYPGLYTQRSNLSFRRFTLQAVSEIFFKCGNKLHRPVSDRGKASCKKPEYGWFLDKFQSSDKFPVMIEPVKPVDNIFD